MFDSYKTVWWWKNRDFFWKIAYHTIEIYGNCMTSLFLMATQKVFFFFSTQPQIKFCIQTNFFQKFVLQAIFTFFCEQNVVLDTLILKCFENLFQKYWNSYFFCMACLCMSCTIFDNFKFEVLKNSLFITRLNCALDKRTFLCLYNPGFQRQVLIRATKCKWISQIKFQWIPRTNASNVNFVGTLILLRSP